MPVFCFKGGKPGWAQTVGGHQGHLKTAVSPGVSCLWSCGWKSFALAVVRLVFGLLSTCLNKNLGSLGSSFGVIFGMCFSFGFRFGLCRLSSKEKGSWVSSDFAREAVSQKLLHQGWVEMWENRIWDFIFGVFGFLVGRSPIEEGASPSMRFNLKCVFSEIWWNGHVRFGCGGTRFEFIAPCGLEKSFGGFPSFYSRRW